MYEETESFIDRFAPEDLEIITRLYNQYDMADIIAAFEMHARLINSLDDGDRISDILEETVFKLRQPEEDYSEEAATDAAQEGKQ